MLYRRIIRIGLAAAALASIAPTGPTRVQPLAAAQPTGQRPAGQSETQLPDGRTLIVGGEGSERSAWIRSLPTDDPRPTNGGLQMGRAWHAATVLADGSVLITGGRDRGAFVEVAEVFDPSTGTFTVISMPTAARRAGHTATLLTDGRVLLVGGDDDPRSTFPTELWDLASQSVVTLPGTEVGRVGHRAILTAEGYVLVSGGRAVEGGSASEVVIIDPITRSLWTLPGSPSDSSLPVLAGSLPQSNATDVPVDVRPVLRFSVEMHPESLTADTLVLTGPEGAIGPESSPQKVDGSPSSGRPVC